MNVVQGIVDELDEIIEVLQAARSSVLQVGERNGSRTSTLTRKSATKNQVVKKSRRKLSAAARKRIAEAQRKRWADKKKQTA